MSQAQRRKAELLSRPELVELARYCGLQGADSGFRAPYRNREWICANLPASIFGSANRKSKSANRKQRGGSDPEPMTNQYVQIPQPPMTGSYVPIPDLSAAERKKLLYCRGPPPTLPVELFEDDPTYEEIYKALYPTIEEEPTPSIYGEIPLGPPELPPRPGGKGKKATEAVITSGGIGTSGGIAGFAEEAAKIAAEKLKPIPDTLPLLPPSALPLPLSEGAKKTLAAMQGTPEPSEIGEPIPELPGLLPEEVPTPETPRPSEYGPGPTEIPSEYGPLPPLEPEPELPGVVPEQLPEIPGAPEAPEIPGEPEEPELRKKKRAKKEKKCRTECPPGYNMDDSGLCLEVMKTCPAVEDCKVELQSLGLRETEARKLLDGVKEELMTCQFSSKGWKQIEDDLKELNLTKEEADRILVSVGKHLVARMKSGETLDTLLETIQKTLDQTSATVAALPPALQEEFAIQSESNIIIPAPPPMPQARAKAARTSATKPKSVSAPPTTVTRPSADQLLGAMATLKKISPEEIKATKAAGQQGIKEMLATAMEVRRGAIGEPRVLAQSAPAEDTDWN